MRRELRVVILLLTVIALFLLLPVAAMAQEVGSDEEGLLLRVNGPVTIAENEVIDNVVVISDNVTVDGTITGSLVVLNGDATINGVVNDDVTVVRGTLDLTSTANVNNVSVIRGDLVQDPAATVAGNITEGDFQVTPWDWGIFWGFIWLGSTLVVLVAGLVFAAIGGRQLRASGDTITRNIGPSLLGVVAIWILLPILMFFVFFTLVGIPLSIGYFLFVLPVVWFLGYLVAGTQLGRLILRRRYDDPHPYLAALLGLIILQVIGILPIFGGFVAFLAGLIGSGALIVLAWRAWRGPGIEEPAPEPLEYGRAEPAQ